MCSKLGHIWGYKAFDPWSYVHSWGFFAYLEGLDFVTLSRRLCESTDPFVSQISPRVCFPRGHRNEWFQVSFSTRLYFHVEVQPQCGKTGGYLSEVSPLLDSLGVHTSKQYKDSIGYPVAISVDSSRIYPGAWLLPWPQLWLRWHFSLGFCRTVAQDVLCR